MSKTATGKQRSAPRDAALPSKQRALIALRSFPSIAAAARSIGCKITELRTAAGQEACDAAVARARQSRIEAKLPAPIPDVPDAVTDREFEESRSQKIRRTSWVKYGNGVGKSASAEFHRRLNTVKRLQKQSDIDTALSKLALMHAAPLARPEVTAVGEYYCRFCKTDVAHDPCENCDRKTSRTLET